MTVDTPKAGGENGDNAEAMSPEVIEAFAAWLAGENPEIVGDAPFCTLMVLDSGARLGLSQALGTTAPCWAVVDGERLAQFSPDTVVAFAELIEGPRRTFEEQLERGAAERGFPGEETLFSFPILGLVRAMLQKDRPHFSRLCLLWLLPSELRALRDDIAKLVDNELLPRQLRELAERLVVPE